LQDQVRSGKCRSRRAFGALGAAWEERQSTEVTEAEHGGHGGHAGSRWGSGMGEVRCRCGFARSLWEAGAFAARPRSQRTGSGAAPSAASAPGTRSLARPQPTGPRPARERERRRGWWRGGWGPGGGIVRQIESRTRCRSPASVLTAYDSQSPRFGRPIHYLSTLEMEARLRQV